MFIRSDQEKKTCTTRSASHFSVNTSLLFGKRNISFPLSERWWRWWCSDERRRWKNAMWTCREHSWAVGGIEKHRHRLWSLMGEKNLGFIQKYYEQSECYAYTVRAKRGAKPTSIYSYPLSYGVARNDITMKSFSSLLIIKQTWKMYNKREGREVKKMREISAQL